MKPTGEKTMSLSHFTIPGYGIKVNRAKFYGQIFIRNFKEHPVCHIIFFLSALFLLACFSPEFREAYHEFMGGSFLIVFLLGLAYISGLSSFIDSDKIDHKNVIINEIIALKHNDKNHSPAMSHFLHFFKNDMSKIYDKNQTEFQKILNSETDLNHQNNDGDTLLLLVVKNMPHSPFIFELLFKGADPHIANNEGISPYDVLKEKNESAFVACVAYEKQQLKNTVELPTQSLIKRL